MAAGCLVGFVQNLACDRAGWLASLRSLAIVAALMVVNGGARRARARWPRGAVGFVEGRFVDEAEALNRSRASSTVMSSTSAMDFSCRPTELEKGENAPAASLSVARMRLEDALKAWSCASEP